LLENNIEIAQAATVVAVTEGFVVDDLKSESVEALELFADAPSLDAFKAAASERLVFTVVVDVVEVVVADAIRAAVFVTLLHFSSKH